MMTTTEVFEIIKRERQFQDINYNSEEKLSSGQTRAVRDLDVTSHLVLLDLYITKAKEAWNVKGDNLPALQQIAKIGAIVVRAMERAGRSEELKKGLR
jgi:hypothetical protein